MAEVVRVEGLRELERRMQRLPDKVAKRVFRGAGNKAARLLAKEATRNARASFVERAGRLFRGIKTSARVKGLGVLGAAINWKIGLSPVGRGISKDRSVFYGRFLERGTKSIDARPFMEPAFKAKQQAMVNEFVRALRAGLDRVARLP
jgi:HK97 gp10 family phage protein